MSDEYIKTCGMCGQELSADDFLSDPDLVPIGMMFIEDDITMAYYMFQHEAASCRSSLVVPVDAFQPFLEEPPPEEILALTDCCERHCVKLSDLSACGQSCFFAPFRRFLLHLIDSKSREGNGSARKTAIAAVSASEFPTND